MPDLNAELCNLLGASAAASGMDISCRKDDQTSHSDLLEPGPGKPEGIARTGAGESQGSSLSGPAEGSQRSLGARHPSLPDARPSRSLEELHQASAHHKADPLVPGFWQGVGVKGVPAEGREMLRLPSASLRPLLAVAEGSGAGETIRVLRERLRIQNSKSAEEASRPLCPRPPPAEPLRAAPSPDTVLGLTSPSQIMEEATRRLRLRRQNSSPDLARTLFPEEEGARIKAFSSQGMGRGPPTLQAPNGSRRPSRTHIPSFEEFKRMRGKSQGILGGSNGIPKSPSGPCLTQGGHPPSWPSHSGDLPYHHSPLPPPANPSTDCHAPPVCTGPAPSSPLHTAAVPLGSSETGNKNKDVSKGDASLPGRNSVTETQSTCCPTLLLEAAAELSAYGVTLQQMKSGLIGSAIDLIKKSCTAEPAAIKPAQLRQLDDVTVNEQSRQSGPVSTATLDGSALKVAASAGARQADRRSLPICRRSSSDAAYGTTETAKAQRECRLRPHFSDPMPADAAKRKQLEMRIAAAAWGLGQKRGQDKEGGGCSPSNMAAKMDDTSPNSGAQDHRLHPGSSRRPKHRWSNLSTDSGVVGLNDRGEEREEEEEEEDEEEEDRGRKSRPGEVERTDSGIGPATAKKWRIRVEETARSVQAWVTHQPCVDCGERDVSEPDPTPAGRRRDHLCGKCAKRRRERKEAILEFVNTESSYGEDLRIIREEFHLPMQAAGLLTPEQLAVVFSNIQELIEVNEKFLERLQDSTEQAFDQNDEDFLTVCIGEMFLEFVNMLPAFQTYCIHQSASLNLLNTLEKEKELLRIFLDVSQNDNTALRRMNLRSFLMAPLQRVTKYPLLLSRIGSSTPELHPDHRGLREAKSRVESHLEHINMKSRQEGAPLWNFRSLRRGSRRHREAADLELREVAVRAVGWLREETRFAMEGTLQSSQPGDSQWSKKGSRSLKFQSLHALLLVNRADPEPIPGQRGLSPSGGGQEAPRDVALVLIRDKSSGKFSLFRRPLHLGNCVVSSDPDCDDTFELLEIPKEVFVFRAADRPRTQHWFQLVKGYSQDLGSWRRRRNALPNIMINATCSRA
ncbi:uncharacterized protein si:dkey-91i10.2 isoform X1 [Hypanus sabinus]|uniref:uncharacterized protein si:dkey-91i10.2 isoform X1 n=1 Tax=Hypanus sabinus TaxID=79690 RepID=UPI0028C442EA|nr:uncharacterized protein si:dkey-91i10.2 isoform X1 [Hypanus sabinus]